MAYDDDKAALLRELGETRVELEGTRLDEYGSRQRVAYPEARVGELHNTIGELRAENVDDRRARWAEEHEKRRDELAKSEASRQAWAEGAMRLEMLGPSRDGILGLLKAVLIGSVYTVDDYFDVGGQPMKVVPAEDIERVVAEVGRRWDAPAFRPWKSAPIPSETACACPRPKAKFPRGWARPQCAVHPDGQGEIRAVPWTEEDAAAFEASVRTDGGE